MRGVEQALHDETAAVIVALNTARNVVRLDDSARALVLAVQTHDEHASVLRIKLRDKLMSICAVRRNHRRTGEKRARTCA